MMRAIALLCCLAAVADAGPLAALATTGQVTPKQRRDGAHARVSFGLSGHMLRQAVGRNEAPLTAEETTAKQIEKLLRGPLRAGVTAIFVADARTGSPLFAVNADDALNPASNVKMLSTAAALELMGPDYRYSTRLFGPQPDADGIIHGDVYLLGGYDPTLSPSGLEDIAVQLAARGVRQLDGNVVMGSDPDRDALTSAIVPIDIIAGEPNQAPIAISPPGFDFVVLRVTATTARNRQRPRLSFAAEQALDPQGHRRIHVTISGSIGQAGVMTYPLVLKDRSSVTAHWLRALLRAHAIAVTGDVAIADFDQFLGSRGGLPAPELAHHDSSRLADIVAQINKRSINWLADRVIMTAAGLARGEPPSMTAALAAMYNWLAHHPRVDKTKARLDSGSGLSYNTRVTTRDLVSIVRSAAGFADTADPKLSAAWLDSLAVAGTDGTLVGRLGSPELRGRVRAKTGTLSTAIALSGVVDIDPDRPLAFAIVTNTDRPLKKQKIRGAHDQIVSALCSYLLKTAKTPIPLSPLPIDATPRPVVETAAHTGDPSRTSSRASAGMVDRASAPDAFEDNESDPDAALGLPSAAAAVPSSATNPQTK